MSRTYYGIGIKGEWNQILGSERDLVYYPNDGGVASVVFTDYQEAKHYAESVITDSDVEWSVEWIGDDDALGYDISISVPTRTHVLVDPVRGEEEVQLQPIMRA